MQGPYEVRLSFKDYGKEALKEVYQKMNEYSALKEEDIEDFPDIDEMITADDIDEDGNIIVRNG
jgi:hypothetical protein